MLKRAAWRILEWPIGLALWAWTRFVFATVRVHIDGPFGAGPAIYAHWHQHLPMLLPLCGRQRCWLMMSTAPRMAPIARWTQLLGLRLVRGASGEGGRAALPPLVEALRAGGSVELAVDGPAGPPFQAKPGCVELALETGVPLIALAYRSPSAFLTPGRWDQQLMVPPFAKLEVVAVEVPREPSDTRESLLARVQATLEPLRVGGGRWRSAAPGSGGRSRRPDFD